jgi:hypothetical protein
VPIDGCLDRLHINSIPELAFLPDNNLSVRFVSKLYIGSIPAVTWSWLLDDFGFGVNGFVPRAPKVEREILVSTLRTTSWTHICSI